MLQLIGRKQVTGQLPPPPHVAQTRLYQYRKTHGPVPPALKSTVPRCEQ